jgi:hypothetical protein
MYSYLTEFVSIREIRVSPLSVFIRVHPWLKKKFCGLLRPRRLCVEGVSVWLRLRRAGVLHLLRLFAAI